MKYSTMRTYKSKILSSTRILARVAARMAAAGLPDFESLTSVADRQDAMLERFKSAGIKVNLPLLLCDAKQCACAGECLEACHFATMHRRIDAFDTVLPILRSRPSPCYQVCIVHPRWEVEEGNLSAISIAAAKQWLVRRFGKLGKGLIAIGIFEVSLNVNQNGERYWAGEIQVIICGADRDALKEALAVEHRYRELRPRQRIVQINEVTNLPRQFMYTQKRFVEQRIAYTSTGTGRQGRRHLPLPAKAQLEFDSWLLSLPIGSRSVCVGMSRRGTRFYLPARAEGGAND